MGYEMFSCWKRRSAPQISLPIQTADAVVAVVGPSLQDNNMIVEVLIRNLIKTNTTVLRDPIIPNRGLCVYADAHDIRIAVCQRDSVIPRDLTDAKDFMAKPHPDAARPVDIVVMVVPAVSLLNQGGEPDASKIDSCIQSLENLDKEAPPTFIQGCLLGILTGLKNDDPRSAKLCASFLERGKILSPAIDPDDQEGIDQIVKTFIERSLPRKQILRANHR